MKDASRFIPCARGDLAKIFREEDVRNDGGSMGLRHSALLELCVNARPRSDLAERQDRYSFRLRFPNHSKCWR
jgi:hypothetical protein